MSDDRLRLRHRFEHLEAKLEARRRERDAFEQKWGVPLDDGEVIRECERELEQFREELRQEDQSDSWKRGGNQ